MGIQKLITYKYYNHNIENNSTKLFCKEKIIEQQFYIPT